MSNPLKKSDRLHQFQAQAIFVLAFLLICRLISMYFIPLNDTTEARYAEIARKMLETGNWVTPLHDYGVPFWAKPPLSTWMAALSMKLFGVNELAVRLPSLLLSIGILGLVWQLAKKRSGAFVATTAVIVLASCLYFFLNAGTVMTDPALLFCTTLSMSAFWQAIVDKSRGWSYLFFVGLGLGLLAKGPIAVVLVGMPIFIWVFIRQQWRALWQQLPWIKGTLLLLAIALPWYLLAESRTPGFLNYFILGEHFGRFLQAGWQGDKYGFAHSAPYGMIWVYEWVGMLPWTIPLLGWSLYNAKKIPLLCKDDDGWVSYLLLTVFMPLAFFTFARNIIYPYTFPTLPAFALLFAELSARASLPADLWRKYIRWAAIPGVMFLAATAVFLLKPQWVAKSQKPVIVAWKDKNPALHSNLVYWGDKVQFSAQFYSGGKAQKALTTETLCPLLSNHLANYIVINSKEPTPLPALFSTHLTAIQTIQVLKERYTLYRAEVFNCP